mmetsp:Transcript_6545/g.15146  ORF Transcript_6545/g.15146 Transcript_6545/m.15146 type:complete len:471 (-) Transcript_6545:138-1550(-)
MLLPNIAHPLSHRGTGSPSQGTRTARRWNSTLLPFFEPSLQETLEEVRGVNLSFATDFDAAIKSADVIMASVSTPLKDSGAGAGYAPDLQFWERIARLIAQSAAGPKTIVERSTVPVKSADIIKQVLAFNNPHPMVVLSNPEFAREGSAMMDQASPERVLIGGEDSEAARAAVEQLVDLYARWIPRERVIVSGLWSAELSKLAANAFLAQRISSINAISALCEKTGADVSEVAYAVGVDSRVGRKHLTASVGFGGACYETHLRNLIYLSRAFRLPQVADYWEHVLALNDWQKRRFANVVVSSMFNTVSGKRLAILGVSYKKNTSDTRNSPAWDICRALLNERAELAVYDPRVSQQAVALGLRTHEKAEQLLRCEQDAYLAAAGAHALLLLTEWDEFKLLDYTRIFESMEKPAFVFDGRNLLDHAQLRDIGFHVYGIGKPLHTLPTEIVAPPAPPPVAAEQSLHMIKDLGA